MKNAFLVALLIFLLIECQSPSETLPAAESSSEPQFDSLLASQVGADAFGMRKYVMAFLKEGPVRDQDSLTAARIQRGHLDNMKIWAQDGKLVLAGPYFEDFEIKGIYIFAVDSKAEAEELVKTDPAIESGRLIMELREWYGSAALMKVSEIHTQIARESI